jgi:site-specific recombinase XerD
VVPRVRFELTTIPRDNIIDWDFNICNFKDFCQINLQLAKTTYSKYGSDLKRFFKFIKRKRSSNVHELIREYLAS